MAAKILQEKKQEFEKDLILLKGFSNEITDENQAIFEAIAKVQNAVQRKYTSAFICEEQTSPNLSDVITGETQESFKGKFVIKPKYSQIQTDKKWKIREAKIKKLLDLSVIYDSSKLDDMEDDTDVLIVVKSRIRELHNDDMFLQKGFDSGNLLIVINDEKLMDCNDIDDCKTCFPDEFKKKLNINGKPPIYIMDFRRLITPNPKPHIDMFSELGINDTYKLFLKTLKEQLSLDKRQERLIKNVDQARAKLTILKKLNDEKIKENIKKTSKTLIEQEENVAHKIKNKTYEITEEFGKKLNNTISNIDTSEPDTSNAGISDEDTSNAGISDEDLERLRNISEQNNSEVKDMVVEPLEDNKAMERRNQRQHSIFAADKVISKIKSESIKLQKEQKKNIKKEIENMIMSLFEDEEYAKYIYGIFEEEDIQKFDKESNETYAKKINDIKNKSNNKDSFLKDVIEISGSLIEEYGEHLKVHYKEFTQLLNGRLMVKFKSMKKAMVHDIYLYVKENRNRIYDKMKLYVQDCEHVLERFQETILDFIDDGYILTMDNHLALLNTFYGNEKNIYTQYINKIFEEINMDFKNKSIYDELKKLTDQIFEQDPFKITKERLEEMVKKIEQETGISLSSTTNETSIPSPTITEESSSETTNESSNETTNESSNETTNKFKRRLSEYLPESGKEIANKLKRRMSDFISPVNESKKEIENLFKKIKRKVSEDFNKNEKKKLKDIVNSYCPLKIDEEIHESLEEIKKFQITEEMIGKLIK